MPAEIFYKKMAKNLYSDVKFGVEFANMVWSSGNFLQFLVSSSITQTHIMNNCLQIDM